LGNPGSFVMGYWPGGSAWLVGIWVRNWTGYFLKVEKGRGGLTNTWAPRRTNRIMGKKLTARDFFRIKKSQGRADRIRSGPRLGEIAKGGGKKHGQGRHWGELYRFRTSLPGRNAYPGKRKRSSIRERDVTNHGCVASGGN